MSGHPEDLKLSPPPKADCSWVWFGAATNTAFAGPWGISYAINLTPDQETGLGSWTEDNFVQALKTGKHGGVSRPIMPPMPWQALSHLTDEDLQAIYRYLHTLPPVRNRVPDYQPPAP
ncbi:MAG: cytochrome c [Candidatus Competibacteraceae bacterium]